MIDLRTSTERTPGHRSLDASVGLLRRYWASDAQGHLLRRGSLLVAERPLRDTQVIVTACDTLKAGQA